MYMYVLKILSVILLILFFVSFIITLVLHRIMSDRVMDAWRTGEIKLKWWRNNVFEYRNTFPDDKKTYRIYFICNCLVVIFFSIGVLLGTKTGIL